MGSVHVIFSVEGEIYMGIEGGYNMEGVLTEATYPSLDWLVSGIFDRLKDDLLEIENNLKSGEYSNEEMIEQVESMRKRFIKNYSDLKIES